jgi:mono/diheme cytochrome c family protein
MQRVVGTFWAVVFAAAAASQDKPPAQNAAATRGAATFNTYCAPCHGTSARGDGPMADSLRYAPADLTAIARRNGGRFPAEKVGKIIDGRASLKGHGGTDMPIWGDAFKNTRQGVDERRVKAIIADLVQYLATLQPAAEK